MTISAQVVAKVMLDMETDSNGDLPAAAAATYRPGMKHEHRMYRDLKATATSSAMPLSVPATYCSSAAVHAACMSLSEDGGHPGSVAMRHHCPGVAAALVPE